MRCDRCEVRTELTTIAVFRMNPYGQALDPVDDCEAIDLCENCIMALPQIWADINNNVEPEV